MTPLCLAQSSLSDSVFNRWPNLLWPLLGLGLIYVAVVVVILAKLLRNPEKPDPNHTTEPATTNADAL